MRMGILIVWHMKSMWQSKKEFPKKTRIIAGSILAAICIILCGIGAWGCVHTGKNGQSQTKDAGMDHFGQSSTQNKDSEVWEDWEGITPDSITRSMDEILTWQCEKYNVFNVQELIDIAYAERAMNGIVQTYVIGLYGYLPGYDYGCYLSRMQDAIREDQISAMSLQKSAMVLSALQADNPVSAVLLEESVGEQGIMSYLYGLLMLDGMAAQDGVWTREELVQEILSRQLSDGGFVIAGEEGDVDVTAMALQALAPYYLKACENAQDEAENEQDAAGQKGTLGNEQGVVEQNGVILNEQLVEAVEAALIFLSDRQLATGDFENGGTPNAESTAQVILALCALKRDVWTDDLFNREGVTVVDGLSRYRNADGGFCHTEGNVSNDMASSQVFAALSAINRSMQGKCFLLAFADYDRDDDSETDTTKNEGQKWEDVQSDAQSQESLTLEEISPDISGKSHRTKDGGMDMRIALFVFILAADCGYLAYLSFSNKYSRKRLCGIVLVTAALAAALWLIRIQSREGYLRQDDGREKEKNITVSMEIRCDTVAGAEEYLPSDGVILEKITISASEGESAFDVLKETARAYDIPLEYEGTAAGDEFAYIEGIAYLYEYDYGELSGWIFLVNGETPNMGCGAYQVADKDEIIWYYTKELGRDVWRQ